jgi:Holliday junction DNA helicase RuvA
MIATLTGTIVSKAPTEVVLDVRGVGYALAIPLSTCEKLGEPGSEARLFTHLHVREDALLLYGFATEEERSLFRLLLSVSGIGPKMGLGMLSGIPVAELRAHLASGNLAALTAVPGIGRKLAERLVLELRDRLGKQEGALAGIPAADAGKERVRGEALLALTSLGYQRPAAEKALRGALAELNGADHSVETLIKLALRHATRT